MPQKKEGSKVPNHGRHASACRICAHAEREHIEQDFIDWESPAVIAKQYNIRNRASVYRHAHACGLLPKRSRNVRRVLERLMERVGEVDVTAGAVVQAAVAYGRLNERGHLMPQNADVTVNEMFEQMSREELEEYAKNGTVPPRFASNEVATGKKGPGGVNS